MSRATVVRPPSSPFSDREGDPHSPWLFGTGPVALSRGFWHAHLGWLFERASTNAERFAPDLPADRHLRVIDRLFPAGWR
jgi:stearoyl-CoA desaturase (Delta-9 desaturase)